MDTVVDTVNLFTYKIISLEEVLKAVGGSPFRVYCRGHTFFLPT